MAFFLHWGGLILAVGFMAAVHSVFGLLHEEARNLVPAVIELPAGKLLIGDSDWQILRRREEALTLALQELADLEEREARGEEDWSGERSLYFRIQDARQAIEEKLRDMRYFVDPPLSQELLRGRRTYREARASYLAHFDAHGSAGFVAAADVLKSDQDSVKLLPLATLFVLSWWFVTLSLLGEGLETNLQRRRHPMWEWLLSHPISTRSVFVAEMVSLLVSNPAFLAAPAFWVVIYYRIHDEPRAWLVGLVAGGSMAVATALVAKSLEIGAMLRLPARTRGAALAMMSMVGYASLCSPFLLIQAPLLSEWILRSLHKVATLLPVIPRFGEWLTGRFGTELHPWLGAMLCVATSSGIAAAALLFSWWAAEKGIAGGFGDTPVTPAILNAPATKRWVRDPFYRKELLWFSRNKSAVVQMFLVPLVYATLQFFRLPGVHELAVMSSTIVAGAIVMLGTFMLADIGPKSLSSEGPALWLAMTWPRGLEGLLRAKARLWWIVASAIVSLALAFLALAYPDESLTIFAIAIGWLLFSGSLALKAVTLASAPSSSGEPEPIPTSRSLAASLGTFTFAVGVVTQQWPLAVKGIVYSWVTSAAMWQNFRARLPYLFDPWSERLPTPPTVMHAMIGISTMVEAGAVLQVPIIYFYGSDKGVALAASFASASATALLCSTIMQTWLSQRGIPAKEIWNWRAKGAAPAIRLFPALGIAATAGVALAAIGFAWGQWIMTFPDVASDVPDFTKILAESETAYYWFAVSAVIAAPLAEEYLFRGLLFRTLDREWGGWRALVGSALFFAVYHAPAAWPPVGLVGLANAWLFKKGGSLWPCVTLHAVYNAILVFSS